MPTAWPPDRWLLLAWPLVLMAGRLMGGGVGQGRAVAWLLAPALGLAAWLPAVHGVGRALESFRDGLWLGTLGVASVGLVGGLLLAIRRRKAAPDQWGIPLPRAMLATAALATLIVSPMALAWAFHDETLITGHLSIASEILRGVYPPRHLTFPQFELRYHYGFNLLTAALSTQAGLSVERSIDAITLASLSYVWCLLWAIGGRLAGTRGAWLAPGLTIFGGGIPWVVPASPGISGALRLFGVIWIDRTPLNPPLISYFFQHPWTLGLPIALAALLIHLGEPGEGRRAAGRLLALLVLLLALAQAQFVLFVSLAATLAVAEPMAGGWRRLTPPRAAATVAAIGLATLLASRMGGFFLPPPDPSESPFVLSPLVARTPTDSLLWAVGTYGFLLPVGLAGLAFVARGRLAVALLIAGGLGVINIVRYKYSADILKFATVSALGLSLAGSAALARVFALRPRWLGLGAGVILLVGSTAAGLVFPVVFALRPDVPPLAIYQRSPDPLTPDQACAVAWLAASVEPDDVTYVPRDLAPAFAQRGGIAVSPADVGTATFGFAVWRFSARGQALSFPGETPDPLLAQRIRWLVLPSDHPLNPPADRWISQGRAREAARFGSLRVVRLLPRPVELR